MQPTPRRIPNRLALAALTATTLLCTSCGPAVKSRAVYPAQGKVLYNGKAITAAFVVLHPKAAGQAERPTGKTRQDGTFRLSTYSDKDGAPAGEYAVTVIWAPPVTKPDGDTVPGPNVLPAKYSKPESSGLVAKIGEGPTDIPVFDLKD